jgi:HK97 family phage prohead protease
MEHKSVAFELLELKKEPDGDAVFEGYASVFGVVDQGMDVVERGAFTKSLGSGRKVKMLWQHDSNKPIGKWDVMQEDERGLFVRGRLLKGIKQAEEAATLMRNDVIDSMSIGYRVAEAMEEGSGRVRKLMEVELFEISLVTFPMLEAAKITAMKSITTIREFEGALRDAGFSKTEAKAIAAEGFKGLSDHRDDVDDDLEDDADNLALQSEIQKLMEAFNV